MYYNIRCFHATTTEKAEIRITCSVCCCTAVGVCKIEETMSLRGTVKVFIVCCKAELKYMRVTLNFHVTIYRPVPFTLLSSHVRIMCSYNNIIIMYVYVCIMYVCMHVRMSSYLSIYLYRRAK